MTEVVRAVLLHVGELGQCTVKLGSEGGPAEWLVKWYDGAKERDFIVTQVRAELEIVETILPEWSWGSIARRFKKR